MSGSSGSETTAERTRDDSVPGDRAFATIAALLAAALVGQQVAAKAIRDALFLSNFQVTSLPWAMLAAALLSIGAAFLFSRAMSGASPSRVMAIGLSLSAVLYVGEWSLSAALPGLVAAMVYVHLALFGPALVSGMWSLINERLDPHAAKSLVGRIGIGASAGGIAAGTLTWLGAGRVPVPAMLLGLALVSAACLAGLRFLRPPDRGPGEAPVQEQGAWDAGSAISELKQSSYLRKLAVLVILASFTEILVDYVFKVEASKHVSGSHALVGFFGAFYTILSILALAIQAVLSKPFLDRFGLSGTVALHPLATGLGAALALFNPSLGVVLLARGANGVLRDSAYRSAYEILYTPLPVERKRATKAVIDVGADKVGAIIGAILVLAQVTVTPARERALLGLVIGACVAALVVARRLNAGYVSTLRESLHAGTVDLEPAHRVAKELPTSATHPTDPVTIRTQIKALDGAAGEATPDGQSDRDTLVEAIIDLRSSRLDRIRIAIKGAYPVDVRLVPFVIPLLGRNDVLPHALRYLRAAAPRSTGLLLDWLLDSETPPLVRARIPRVLKSVLTPQVLSGLVRALDDPLLVVRHEAAIALATITSRDANLTIAPETIFLIVVRELEREEESDKVLDHAFTLLGLVLERDHLRTALHALQTDDQRLRGIALEYLENVLPDHIRQPLWPRIAPESPRDVPPRALSEVAADLLGSMAGLRPHRLGPRIRVPRRPA